MIEHTFESGAPLTTTDVKTVSRALRTLGGPDTQAAELIEQVTCLEELKSAAAAAQARVTAVFAAKQHAERRSAGASAQDAAKGIGAQIALARRESPHQGARYLGLAEALVYEMPHTLAALAAGQISEWRATLIARETACVAAEHRRRFDAELANRPGGLAFLGDAAVAAEARRISYRLDPHAVTRRASRAGNDRHVTLRPTPDTMTWLGALLPAHQGVAAYAALTAAADTARATGDERGRGQVMADTMVERVTGQASAAAVPIEINLVMTDRTLLAGDDEPAELHGVGPIPAPLARTLLRGERMDATDPAYAGSAGSDARATVWLRRLYTHPTSRQLVAMDSRWRCFTGQLRGFLIAADRTCRTPWCDAPIRHIDHPDRAAGGGPTSAGNSQGLCEACNYAREARGWRTLPQPNRVVDTFTPTGHSYRSHAPPAIGRASLAEQNRAVDERLPHRRDLVATA